MRHEEIVSLPEKPRPHILRVIVQQEAHRLAADPTEYRRLVKVGLKRLYGADFTGVRNIPGWLRVAAREQMLEEIVNVTG